MGSRWTQTEYDSLRAHVGKMSLREIAAEMGRSYDAVSRAAQRIGLRSEFVPANKQPWSDAEIRVLRRDYRKKRTSDIAAALGRERKQVFNKAFELGLCRKQRIRHAELEKLVREKHALGWSDAEIAAAFGCERHTIGIVRKKLGLPASGRGQHYRERVRQKTAEQLAAAGVATLGQLRAKVYAARSQAAGWPAGLRPRAVEILNALWERGPQTRRQLAAAVGMPWHGSRKSLHSNDREGSYVANLMARGLVVKLGRVVKGKGSGHSVCLYSLPMGIERRLAK
jgi:hypothetical protein